MSPDRNSIHISGNGSKMSEFGFGTIEEIHTNFSDIQRNGNWNGNRKCIHCKHSIRWKEYHMALCPKIQQSSNVYQKYLFAKIYSLHKAFHYYPMAQQYMFDKHR